MKILLLGFLVLSGLSAQKRVDMRNTYQRVLAVVPIVGSGTAADPYRPKYAPLPSEAAPASRTGILGFTFLPSDDKKTALVEFVGRDRAALSAILADKSIKVFEKGKASKAEIETEFRKYKKSFDLDTFGVIVP